MALEHVLLGLLKEPASGYDIKGIFDGAISHYWAAELSQIYPCLKRLERDGLIVGSDAIPRRGFSRRIYTRTTAGEDLLFEWLRNGPTFGDERHAYLAQLNLIGQLGNPSSSIEFLHKLRERFAAKLDILRSTEDQWRRQDSGYPNNLPIEEVHLRLTLTYGISTLASAVAWSDEAIKELQSLQARMDGTR